MKKKYYKGVAYYPVDWVEKKFANDKTEIDDLKLEVEILEGVLAKKRKGKDKEPGKEKEKESK